MDYDLYGALISGFPAVLRGGKKGSYLTSSGWPSGSSEDVTRRPGNRQREAKTRCVRPRSVVKVSSTEPSGVELKTRCFSSHNRHTYEKTMSYCLGN